MQRSAVPSDAVPPGWACGAISALSRSRRSIRRWSKDQSSSSPSQKEYLTSPTRKNEYLTSPTRKKEYLTSPTRKNDYLTSPTRREGYFTDRINELTQENQRLRSEMEQMRTRERRSCAAGAEQVLRINELTQENQRLRSELKQMQTRKKRSCGRCEDLTQEHAKRIKALRFDLEQKEAELKQNRERSVLSVCRRCEDQAQEHKQTVHEMETFYRSKLSEARSALEQKEEQFRSFKDRVAENVLLSSTTENTENMNSPVNRSRLTEMYQQLRVCVWPHINWTQPEHRARDLVQEVFSRAHENMTKALSTVCAGSTSSPQVDTFRRRALENLQMVLLHSSKQQVCVKAFPSLSGPELDLASECYWLGCLMALHSPPLHPDWDRGSGLVFPRDIREIRTKRRYAAPTVTHL